MATLVTGGAGYIGSHTVWALLDAGEEVVVVDDLSTGFDWAVAPGARLYQADIADETTFARICAENAIDAIIHFAGSVVVPESVYNPLKYYENNTAKSRSLIELAVKAGVRHMVFSSTAAVYGTPRDTAPLTEDAPTAPESPYGMSKLMTEVMLKDTAAAHDFVYTALRYFNVAGADPQGRTGQSTAGATHLIKVACETALGKRERIEVFGTDYDTPDGTCIRDYIHVTDLAHAHVLALKRMRAGGGALVANCGYGRGYSVLEVLEAVQRVSGASMTIVHKGRRPGDAIRVVAVPHRAKATLGWAPAFDDLDEIVRSALAWEKSLPRAG